MSEELLKPSEVCRRLGMPPSTLRIYSTKFAEVLSETASRPTDIGEGRGGHRLYNSRDLMVLGRAKELLAHGLTYDQALAELRLVVPGVKVRPKPEAPGPAVMPSAGGTGGIGPEMVGVVLETLRAAIANSEKVLSTCTALMERQAKEIEELRIRIARLEGEMERMVAGERRRQEERKGWWGRMFGG